VIIPISRCAVRNVSISGRIRFFRFSVSANVGVDRLVDGRTPVSPLAVHLRGDLKV
jgi:hypothetical protein